MPKSISHELYRRLPQLGECLERADVRPLLARYPRAVVLNGVRAVIAELRERIAAEAMHEREIDAAILTLPASAQRWIEEHERPSLRRVINATGVILQTNLGRAPLSESAVEQIVSVARGYCNLEFDLQSGHRGQRGAEVERLLLQALELEGGEHAALIVNNCAAATFLALNTVAEGGEVIVSRGELVEIGGGFRVPEILRKSGATLREVGTTNRTRIEDYAAAIGAETRAILRVHRSNFAIVGFTEEAPLNELVALGREAAVPVIDDQGTGCMVALDEYELPRQHSLRDSMQAGATIVCASGDKLLGGPQCGLVVGHAGSIKNLRQNPLYRALRVDKLTYAALEATLRAYTSGVPETIPAIRMLAMDADEIRARCEACVDALSAAESVTAHVVACESVVGGGTTPGTALPSFAVALGHADFSEDEFAAALRALDPPVIGRVGDGRVLLDLRTVFAEDDSLLIAQLREAIESLHTKRAR